MQKTISLFGYLSLFIFINFLFFSYPLFSYVLSHVESSPYKLIATCIVAFFGGNFIVLTLFSLLGRAFLKSFCILSILGNSIALYFVTKYNVILDLSMMGNLYNTNFDEASGLYSHKIILYFVAFGILPSAFLWRFKIAKTSFKQRFFIILASLIIILSVGFLHSSSWLWFDKHAKYLGGLWLPYSYEINFTRYALKQRAKTPPKLLSEINFKNNDETLVVLVIGESARRANFSLFGYEKETNEFLKKEDIVALKAQSCTTYTSASIKCMLSHNDSNSYENLPSYLHRHGIAVLWRSANWGEENVNVALYQKRHDIKTLCKKDCENLEFDEVLLYDLKNQIEKLNAKKSFIVLHQSGSHGPSYNKKYPNSFEKFKPVCESVELSNCTKEELINTYDNTIFYNDYFLSRLINELKKFDKKVVMVYMSDHGESLGEKGFYLHGTPKQIAPSFQYEIPLILWLNDKAKEEFKIREDKDEFDQSFVFHTILRTFGGESKEYDKNKDIFK